MKLNRAIQLCAVSICVCFAIALFSGWHVRWFILPTGHPIPIPTPY